MTTTDTTGGSAAAAGVKKLLYQYNALRPALDGRLARIHFVHDRIENRLNLLTDSTHVYMFDAVFHSYTIGVILPVLCRGPRSRIVISCQCHLDMRDAWSVDDPLGVPSLDEIKRTYRLLKQLPITLAGSKGKSRVVYVYATVSRRRS